MLLGDRDQEGIRDLLVSKEPVVGHERVVDEASTIGEQAVAGRGDGSRQGGDGLRDRVAS